MSHGHKKDDNHHITTVKHRRPSEGATGGLTCDIRVILYNKPLLLSIIYTLYLIFPTCSVAVIFIPAVPSCLTGLPRKHDASLDSLPSLRAVRSTINGGVADNLPRGDDSADL